VFETPDPPALPPLPPPLPPLRRHFGPVPEQPPDEPPDRWPGRAPGARRAEPRARRVRPGGPYVIRRADGAYAPVRVVPLEPARWPDVDADADADDGPSPGRVPSSVAATAGLAMTLAWAAFVLVGLRWPHVARTSGGLRGVIDHSVWRTLLADRIIAVAGWMATATTLFVLGGALFRVLVAGPVERRAARPGLDGGGNGNARRNGQRNGGAPDRRVGPERRLRVVATSPPAAEGAALARAVAARNAAVVRGAALVGVLASGVAVVLRAVELSAGSVSIGLTRLGFVTTTPFGIAAVARVAGLAVLAWSASTPTGGPAGGRAAALGGVAVLAAFALVGHPQATPAASPALRGGLVAAQVAHVLMTAIWFGGICLLALELRERRRLGDPRGSAAVIARFSSLAGLAVVGVTATGLALARSQVDSIAGAPHTAYGRALIAKLGCVALVVAIGGYNRQFLVPAVERAGDTAGAWRGLRRTLLAESLVIGCGVLVATAAMTSGGF
jgi:putative copper export protein